MKGITLAAAALTVLSALSPAAAQTAAREVRPATLTVNGQGSVDRNPDRAIVSFSVVTNDANAARATSENNVVYNALLAKLNALGLSGSAIKTTSYHLTYSPRPPQPNPQFPQRYGYIVTRGVTVTTDRTDQAGPIIDAGVAAGVGDVGSVTFGLRDQRSAYNAAQAAAVADADSQAHALAAAAHLRIVRILTISSGGGYARPFPIGLQAEMRAAPTVPTQVQPSDLTIQATVGVTYEVAPAGA
jgi:uncharacterized protein